MAGGQQRTRAQYKDRTVMFGWTKSVTLQSFFLHLPHYYYFYMFDALVKTGTKHSFLKLPTLQLDGRLLKGQFLFKFSWQTVLITSRYGTHLFCIEQRKL